MDNELRHLKQTIDSRLSVYALQDLSRHAQHTIRRLEHAQNRRHHIQRDARRVLWLSFHFCVCSFKSCFNIILFSILILKAEEVRIAFYWPLELSELTVSQLSIIIF